MISPGTIGDDFRVARSFLVLLAFLRDEGQLLSCFVSDGKIVRKIRVCTLKNIEGHTASELRVRVGTNTEEERKTEERAEGSTSG